MTGKRVQFFAVDSISVPVALLVAIFLMVLVSEWVAARVRAAIR